MKAQHMKFVIFRMPPKEYLDLKKFLLGRMSMQRFLRIAVRRQWNELLVSSGKAAKWRADDLAL